MTEDDKKLRALLFSHKAFMMSVGHALKITMPATYQDLLANLNGVRLLALEQNDHHLVNEIEDLIQGIELPGEQTAGTPHQEFRVFDGGKSKDEPSSEE